MIYAPRFEATLNIARELPTKNQVVSWRGLRSASARTGKSASRRPRPLPQSHAPIAARVHHARVSSHLQAYETVSTATRIIVGPQCPAALSSTLAVAVRLTACLRIASSPIPRLGDSAIAHQSAGSGKVSFQGRANAQRIFGSAYTVGKGRADRSGIALSRDARTRSLSRKRLRLTPSSLTMSERALHERATAIAQIYPGLILVK